MENGLKRRHHALQDVIQSTSEVLLKWRTWEPRMNLVSMFWHQSLELLPGAWIFKVAIWKGYKPFCFKGWPGPAFQLLWFRKMQLLQSSLFLDWLLKIGFFIFNVFLKSEGVQKQVPTSSSMATPSFSSGCPGDSLVTLVRGQNFNNGKR